MELAHLYEKSGTMEMAIQACVGGGGCRVRICIHPQTTTNNIGSVRIVPNARCVDSVDKYGKDDQ